MSTFTPTITTNPDDDYPVRVTIPGETGSHGLQDRDQADRHIRRYEPTDPYTTRITTNADRLRRVLAPLVDIAHRTHDIPALNTVRIHSLDNGATRLCATDRFIIMRGKLPAAVLGEPVNFSLRAGEAQIILDILGTEPGPVEHCESCAEAGAVDACWREHGEPSRVTLDISPCTIKVTVGSYYKTTISFDTGDHIELWERLDPMVDELIRPDELNIVGFGCNPALVPDCGGIALMPRADASGQLRWGIADRRADFFDGMLMPVTEPKAEEADQ